MKFKPETSKDPRVIAVRNDEKVGHGSCSVIDETMTDDELVQYLDECEATTPAKAVKQARWKQRIFEERLAETV